MKTAQELYPDCDVGYGPSDYTPIIESCGEVLCRVDDGGYHGDSRVVVKNDEGKFGLLIFGWGSCSVCDALQAAGNWHELQAVVESVQRGVVWFATLDALKQYVADDEARAGSHYWHEREEWKKFQSLVAELP
jgi:hypothetical protein